MGLRCKNIFGKMVIYIDDEGMKMEDGGEMDLLYREKEGRTRVNRYRENAGKSKK